ncbi:MAG: type VII toxin-antitoxin system HepT family RNase toxin [Candidatus Omnitrophota bacterium]
MIDYKGIAVRLDKLNEYLKFLKSYQKISFAEFKKDYTLQGAVCRYFQLAVECVTDTGELLISSLALRKPKDAKEVIMILGENKIIPAAFAKRFAPVAGFRNILVHEYLEIDFKKVYQHLRKDLSDFNLYAKRIALYVKAKSRLTQ